jgi:hypothetical protein
MARMRVVRNPLLHPHGWDELVEDAARAGHEISEPAPRAIIHEIGSRSDTLADTMARNPGLGLAVNDLIKTAWDFSRRQQARPEEITIDGARTSSTGVFSCTLRRK